MSYTKKAWISAMLLALTLAVNALGALGFINGLSQKEVSDRYQTLITPSPATFSIWSVIYLLLIVSAIAMIVKKKDAYYRKAVNEISLLFWLSSLMNMAWIVSFSYLWLGLSVIFIISFLITLALILVKLRRIHGSKRFLLPLSFGLYAGWLFIATVVNTAAWLVKAQWDGFGIGDDIWAIIILVVALLLAFLVLIRIRNAIFPIPIAWAYFGIYQFLNSPEGFKGQYEQLSIVALGGMGMLIGMAALLFYQNRFMLLPNHRAGRNRN